MKKQLQFEGFKRISDTFGGSLLKNHPKERRPLDSKLPIHLVLRATESRLRLPIYFAKVGKIIEQTAKKHGVRIYQGANVGNHIHLLIKLTTRLSWSAFIRELTGRISLLTKTKWKYRPFTRIVRGWKKAYQNVKDYIYLNWLEAEGFINREETKTLKDLHAIWADD